MIEMVIDLYKTLLLLYKIDMVIDLCNIGVDIVTVMIYD